MEQLDEMRAIAPLPPLPPDRVAFSDQETSLDQAAPAADGAGPAQQPPLQLVQFPQFSHAAAAMQNMMGPRHPFLAGSQSGSLVGDMPFLHNRPPHFGESYGGFAGMSGMHHGHIPPSPTAHLLGGAPGGYHPSMNPTRNYDNVLFAPGVTWGSVAASGQRVNDPIQVSLSQLWSCSSANINQKVFIKAR